MSAREPASRNEPPRHSISDVLAAGARLQQLNLTMPGYQARETTDIAVNTDGKQSAIHKQSNREVTLKGVVGQVVRDEGFVAHQSGDGAVLVNQPENQTENTKLQQMLQQMLLQQQQLMQQQKEMQQQTMQQQQMQQELDIRQERMNKEQKLMDAQRQQTQQNVQRMVETDEEQAAKKQKAEYAKQLLKEKAKEAKEARDAKAAAKAAAVAQRIRKDGEKRAEQQEMSDNLLQLKQERLKNPKPAEMEVSINTQFYTIGNLLSQLTTLLEGDLKKQLQEYNIEKFKELAITIASLSSEAEVLRLATEDYKNIAAQRLMRPPRKPRGSCGKKQPELNDAAMLEEGKEDYYVSTVCPGPSSSGSSSACALNQNPVDEMDSTEDSDSELEFEQQ